MTLQRQVMFWVGALVAFILLFWLLHEVLLPFVAGMVLAYFLHPVADWLERHGVHRAFGTLIIIGLFVLIFVIAAVAVVPFLLGQLGAFIQRLPSYVMRLQELVFTAENKEWLSRAFGGRAIDVQKTVGDLVTQGAGWFGTFLTSLWSGGRALVSIFSIMIITPVVAFYLLFDWPKMVRKVDSWVPRKHQTTIRGLAREMDRAVAGFLRGQASVALILGSYYAVCLTVIELNFGLLIGAISGLLTFIPYVGSLFGLIVGTGVAVVQFWPNWVPIAIVLGIFIFGQVVEGYILAPKLVGESIGLHPVWLMLALFVFGYLFGFVGLLLAVPLAAVAGVLVRFALRHYLSSPLFTGEPRRGHAE